MKNILFINRTIQKSAVTHHYLVTYYYTFYKEDWGWTISHFLVIIYRFEYVQTPSNQELIFLDLTVFSNSASYCPAPILTFINSLFFSFLYNIWF